VDEKASLKVRSGQELLHICCPQNSVLVCELVGKFWKEELQSVSLRNEGNKLFQRKELAASLVKYTEAYEKSPEDHLTTSNRSHAYFKAAQYTEALADADRTVALKPDWGKGHFRRGLALTALGRFDDGLVALFQCLVLEESCCKGALRDAIYNVLYKLVTSQGGPPGGAGQELERGAGQELEGGAGQELEAIRCSSEEDFQVRIHNRQELFTHFCSMTLRNRI
jgi:tetratricopeptide (TPR) repeat protein